MDRDERGDPPTTTGAEVESEVPLDVLPLHSTNLLTVLDGDGVIRYESPSIERIYGYDQDDLVGDRVAEYVHPDDREDVMAAFRAVVDSDTYTAEAVEYRHRTADGTFVWVESVASANPTPDGNYVVNTRDVSERKKRERNLERTNERLDRFARFVSHDLRNPLNVAQGQLRLGREECDNEHLVHVSDAHDRMETLIENLLTASGEQGQAHERERVTETEPISLERLAENCWRMVGTRDATLVVDGDRSLHAGRSRLRQLLENLIRNAVEHGSASNRTAAEKSLTVTVGAMDGGFYVEDDGPGIPEEERQQVFEAGHSTAHDGTGLGLHIVEQVVDAHDWRIRVTDGSRGGTRFEITDVDPVE
jgi:PAS domain S-box-containing protein